MQDLAFKIEKEIPGQKGSYASSAPRYVIDIVALSKSFKRKSSRQKGYTTLKSAILRGFRKRQAEPANITTAIQDLTLRIPAGLSVGIIGRNGSGKSTLLKLISGIYKPDRGTVSIAGRIAALIELGAGFHPDFTGRENLYLGAAIHGLSRDEINNRFEEIVRFAELENVIDDPVKTYSSGMFMRLGFSLAIHTNPDILIVDEVLAVGDATFVNKCKEKISELKRSGKTLLFVSHDLDAVERWCDEALWLEAGRCRDRGEPRRVIDSYRHFIDKSEEDQFLKEETGNSQIAAEENRSDDNSQAQNQNIAARWGSREVEIEEVLILNSDGGAARVFQPEDSLTIEIRFKFHQKVEDLVFGLGISRLADNLLVHGSNTEIEKVKLPGFSGNGLVKYVIKRVGLLDGTYLLDVACHRPDGYAYDYRKNVLRFSVRSALNQVGVMVPEHRWEF
jgi:ABC-type polysaccharide/polyol phosphate transport system ATPase subunit